MSILDKIAMLKSSPTKTTDQPRESLPPLKKPTSNSKEGPESCAPDTSEQSQPSQISNKPGKGEFLPGDSVVDDVGRHGVIEANLSMQYSVEFGNGRIGFYFKADKQLEKYDG